MSAEHPEIFDIWTNISSNYICIVHSVDILAPNNSSVFYNIAFSSEVRENTMRLDVFLEMHTYVGNIKDNFLELEREILDFVRSTA